MGSAEILDRLYKNPKPVNFDFNLLQGPKVYQVLTPKDVEELYNIATSLRLNGNINKKYKLIKEILERRGFKYLGAGTNRVVYKYLEDPSFVLKVAVDNVGLSDNPAEFKNQWLLQPFCTRMYDVDPTGTVATVERVQGIQSLEEYMMHSDDILLLIDNVIGKYVLEDIGCKFFRNVGIRSGYGPVYLDYPYVHELDGDKLYCNFIMENGQPCNGEIDYDDGFNFLICKKCGRRYRARELQKSGTEACMISLKGRTKMRVVARIGDKIVVDSNTTKASKTFEKPVEDKPIIKHPVVTYTGFTPASKEEDNEDDKTTRKTSSDNSRKRPDRPMQPKPEPVLTTEMVNSGVGVGSYTGFTPAYKEVEEETVVEETPVVETQEVEETDETPVQVEDQVETVDEPEQDTEEEQVEEEEEQKSNGIESVDELKAKLLAMGYKLVEIGDEEEEEERQLANGKDPYKVIEEELFGKDDTEEEEGDVESETSATSEDPYDDERRDMEKVDAMSFGDEFDVQSPFMKNASDDDIAEKLKQSTEQAEAGSTEINYTSPEKMYNIDNSEGRYPARRKRR